MKSKNIKRKFPATKKVKDAMFIKQITQEELASKLGLTTDTVNRKLNGLRDWKSSEIYRVCNILDIPLEEVHVYFYPTESRIS